MNYEQIIADIRAESASTARRKPTWLHPRLLTAMELLAEANKRSIRLKRRDRVEDVRQRCFEVKR